MAMRIATHDGVFHADEVFACATLLRVYPDAEIIRTRDREVYDGCDIVVDVGGIYDPEKGLFDHHQRFFEERYDNGVILSSFGLVWRAYQGQVVGNDPDTRLGLGGTVMVEHALVMPVDAVDNGQPLYNGGEPCFKGLHGMDSVSGLSVSRIVSSFNPTWQEPKDREHQDQCFHSALKVASQLLDRQIQIASAHAEGRAEVGHAAYNARFGDHKEIICLERAGLPWQAILCQMETPTYVIFPTPDRETWMVQCVPPEVGSFEKRKPLPKAWAGLRDADLAALTVEGAVFCHNGRFIAGAKTFDGAYKMAEMALASE